MTKAKKARLRAALIRDRRIGASLTIIQNGHEDELRRRDAEAQSVCAQAQASYRRVLSELVGTNFGWRDKGRMYAALRALDDVFLPQFEALTSEDIEGMTVLGDLHGRYMAAASLALVQEAIIADAKTPSHDRLVRFFTSLDAVNFALSAIPYVVEEGWLVGCSYSPLGASTQLEAA